MATTETRTGFRLPWSSDNRAPDSTNGADTAAALETTDAGAEAGFEAVVPASETEPAAEDVTQAETRTDTHADASDAGATPVSAIPTPEAEIIDTPMFETPVAPTVPHVSAASSKRPTKFLADLTNAMRAAAEAERAEILERFRAEAKAFVEQIHERSGGDATELRKQTDDDIASIRDWSKAEIARIREETDERIAHRKSRLDRELEAHAARIEREVERVNSAVDGFEASMARFFEGLLNEDDPTSFAERAANLPEPPSLEDELDFADAPSAAPTPTTATFVVSQPAPPTSATFVASEPPAPVVETSSPPSEPAPVAVAVESEPVTAEMPGANLASAADASASDHPDPGAEGLDPRVAALGLSPDFAAAEAEALQNVDASSADDDGSAEPVPALDDEAIAARLAGLPQPEADPSAEPVSTQVVVTGLVSVASIAGFKRHLGRLAGVRSVGVSSGPEGEFLFTVTHGAEAALHDAIPTLPGFAARIVGDGEGILRVSARDPETDG